MSTTELQGGIVVDGLLGDGPPFLVQVSVEREHTDVFGRRHRQVTGAAGCGWDADTAATRCRSEAAERLTASSPSTIRQVVVDADDAPPHNRLPWWSFSSYDPDVVSQLAAAAPYDDEFLSVAVGMGTGQPTLVPASRVILHWDTFVGQQAMAGECDASGLAAGPDVESAALHGLREVLERDAIMRAWRDPTWRGRALAPDAVDGTLLDWLAASSLGVRLLDVAHPGLDPVVVALLHNHDGATVGSACREALADAATAAVLEAAMLRSTIDVLGAASSTDPIATSLDHVRFGYRHADVLGRWIDHLAGHRNADAAPTVGRLVDRVTDVFGAEPLVVILADGVGGAEALFAVVRVLLPGATRKEWRHDLRLRALSNPQGGPQRACHDLPHPFG